MQAGEHMETASLQSSCEKQLVNGGSGPSVKCNIEDESCKTAYTLETKSCYDLHGKV